MKEFYDKIKSFFEKGVWKEYTIKQCTGTGIYYPWVYPDNTPYTTWTAGTEPIKCKNSNETTTFDI